MIFSRDEQKQFEMAQQYPPNKFPKIKFYIGDVTDEAGVKRVLKSIDYVIHVAAMKHVSMVEYNPMECVKNNIMGAENIINACLETELSKIVALSTDKAAAPTKLASDKLYLAIL